MFNRKLDTVLRSPRCGDQLLTRCWPWIPWGFSGACSMHCNFIHERLQENGLSTETPGLSGESRRQALLDRLMKCPQGNLRLVPNGSSASCFVLCVLPFLFQWMHHPLNRFGNLLNAGISFI